MKTNPAPTALLLGLLLIPGIAHGELIFSDSFAGDATNLNGATPEVGVGTWVASAPFDRNGDVNITNGGAGSATLAFTPTDGLVYTLEASVTLSTGGAGDWIGFGFANGQSATSTTSNRFLTGNAAEGRAWMFFRENTNNPSAQLTGNGSGASWTGFTQSPSDLDVRIVLDTTGGVGAWTATWFAKAAADADYTEVRATTALDDEDITSIGFAVSGSGVSAEILSFTLSDNVAPTPPSITETDPADDATGVAPDTSLVATFDKTIQLGTTGDVTIRNLSNPADVVISLPGPDPDGTLSVEGAELTITPAALLTPGDEYVIEIGAGVVESIEAQAFAGLSETDDPNWSFRADDVPPAIEGLSPALAAEDAPPTGGLFLTFDEGVQIGSGNIVIHRSDDDSVVETIDVTSGSVLVSGQSLTILPSVALAFNTSYYVLIDDGAVEDAWGNAYAGITDPATWTFSTVAEDPTLLFADTFQRPDDADPDALDLGKYGSLGALGYTARTAGTANFAISNGQLLLQSNEGDGNSGAIAYINDHNFIDEIISSGGGFSITVDLNAYLTQGSGRYMTVGVGQSLTELDGLTSVFPSSSAADLLIGYRATNSSLEVFNNGTKNNTESIVGGLPDAPTTMRIEYDLPDFNAGSTVDYRVYFDDAETPFASGSFTWSGTGENYISLSSNLFADDTPGDPNALFDNLAIRANAAVDTLLLEITRNGDTLDFEWNGLSGKQYDLLSSTDLSTPPSSWSPYNDGTTTYENIASSGDGTNTLTGVQRSGPRRFFALREEPFEPVSLLSADFDAGDEGFTVVDHSAGTGSLWELGNPDSSSVGGSVLDDNGGGGQCWGTDIGSPGFYASGTDCSLISPVIDLTAVPDALLSFAEAIDILSGDSFVVNVIDDDISGGISVLEAAVHTSTPDPDIGLANWTDVTGVAITGGQPVRIEFRFTGDNDGSYMGAYVDDVSVIAAP